MIPGAYGDRTKMPNTRIKKITRIQKRIKKLIGIM